MHDVGDHCPLPPHSMVVFRASAISRAQPCPEPAETLPEPARHNDRRGQRSGHSRQQRIQPLHPGVAVPRARFA
jgi:hypothetical protein